jgi:capsular polysaccharide biosynthesis protein
MGLGDWLRRETPIPATGVLFLDGGMTYGMECWTISADGGWVYDASLIKDSRLHRFGNYFPPHARKKAKYRGRCLDLGSNSVVGNCGHWLRDSIGRLMVAEAAGLRFEDFDWIRLPIGKFPNFCPSVIAALDIPREKIITPTAPRMLMQFDELVRPFLPGETHYTHPALPGMMASRFALPPKGPGKIYLRRKSKRNVSNQQEIEALVESRGFTIIDPRKVPFGSWTNARVLIAPHQAAMVEMMFCKPGVKVLELMSPSWQRPFYSSMADGCGHDYWAIIGSNGTNGRDVMNEDYSVTVQNVAAWIDRIEA